MTYNYSAKQIQQWEWPAQAETYRLKFLHQQQETNHWRGRATFAERQLAAITAGSAGTSMKEGI